MKDEIIIKKIIVYIDKIIDYCQSYCYDSFANNSMELWNKHNND